MGTYGSNIIQQHSEMESYFDENGFEIEGTSFIRQQLNIRPLDENNIQQYIGDQIRTMALIESKIEASQVKARLAQEKANVAQGKIRVFHKTEAIEKLQEATLAEAEALGEIVDCNTCIFENQKAMAEVTKRLLFLGVGNMARNRIVVKKISDYLSGMNSGDPNSMMKCELIGIVSELNSQLDLMQRVQNISIELNDFDDDIKLVRLDVDETKKSLEEKDKSLKALSKGAAEMQKDLEGKGKTLEALSKDAVETKKTIEEKGKTLEALSMSTAKMQKDMEDKNKTLEALSKDATETKKALEEKDKALEALSKDAAETKKALEEKCKALEAFAETKKVLEEKENALIETKELAEMALKKAGDVSKKNTIGMWILGGVIVIAAISLALIFGNLYF